MLSEYFQGDESRGSYFPLDISLAFFLSVQFTLVWLRQQVYEKYPVNTHPILVGTDPIVPTLPPSPPFSIFVGEDQMCSVSAYLGCEGLWAYDCGHVWYEYTPLPPLPPGKDTRTDPKNRKSNRPPPGKHIHAQKQTVDCRCYSKYPSQLYTNTCLAHMECLRRRHFLSLVTFRRNNF